MRADHAVVHPPRTAAAVVSSVPVSGLVVALSRPAAGTTGRQGHGARREGRVPTVLWEAQLKAFGKLKAFPVRAGPQADRRYEVTRTAAGRVFMICNRPYAKVGSDQPVFLALWDIHQHPQHVRRAPGGTAASSGATPIQDPERAH